MGYTLAVAALRRVEHDDRGRLISRTRYVKGDVIEGLPEADVNRLLSAGAIVAEDDSEVEDDEGDVGDDASGDDGQGDDLDDLDYAALQDRAKEAGIPANQSAADLREALRNLRNL